MLAINMLEAQDLFQAQLRVQGPECRLRVLRWDTETPVESRQELLQHAVGFPDAARPCQPQFGYEAVLESFRHPLHSSLGLGERANIIWTPSSSMARLNWVGIPGRPEPGVCLKTPCRSVYRARGMPRCCKRRWISRK